MDGYTEFFIEERNGYPQSPGAQYYIRALAGDESEPRYALKASSLVEAKEAVRSAVQRRLDACLEAAEGWRRQLSEIDQNYRPVPTADELVASNAPALLTALRRYRETGGKSYLRLGALTADIGTYLNTHGLTVFHLAEYEPVSLGFTPSSVDALLELFEQAGFERGCLTHWNGAPFFSLSVRVPASKLPHQDPPAAPEPAVTW